MALEERDDYQLMRTDALDEHRLRRLIEVCRALVSQLDLEVVLWQALEVARELTGAHYVALGVLDERREQLERFLTLGVDDATREAIGDLPRGEGVLGELIRDPRPLRLGDVTQHPRSYGFPPGHPPMRSFLGVPIMIRGEAWGNLYLTEKAGGDFDEADEQSALILAEWTAIAVDNARLYRNVEEQRDTLERAVRGLEATTEIARAIGGETDIGRILETIVKRGRALVEARSLLILLEERGELRLAAVAGESDHDPELRIPIAGSAPGEVLESRSPSRIRDLGSNLMSQPRSQGSGAAALLVPLVFRGKSVGVLVALDPLAEEIEFSGESERVLGSFAASAATAVATAQSVAEDQLRNSIEAAERERGRWARELHDESLQSLAGLRVLLSTALRTPGSSDDTNRLLAQAIDQVDGTIAEMRRLIADLRPPTLDELGLAAALEALVERLTWGHVLEVELEIDLAHEAGRHPTRLLGQIEDTIYRLVQEALNNAARHSGTNRATVVVSQVEETIEIRIEDDGAGFDPAHTTGGFGLVGMSERVTLAGGSFEVNSAPGAGTTIAATLPARHRERPETSSLTETNATDERAVGGG
jgi:signal transduction histidine kinase